LDSERQFTPDCHDGVGPGAGPHADTAFAFIATT